MHSLKLSTTLVLLNTALLKKKVACHSTPLSTGCDSNCMCIEIPYEPDQSCIIDTCLFTSYADMDAYEYARLTGDHQEFILYQDPDVLKQDMVHPINDDALGKFDMAIETLKR